MTDNNKEESVDYIKIDSTNKLQFLDSEDLDIEALELKSSVDSFAEEFIGSNMTQLINTILPKFTEPLKTNLELIKQYLKSQPKKTEQEINDSINRIIASDFQENFVFNEKNVEDVCQTLCIGFETIRKKNWNVWNEPENLVKYLNFEDIDIINLYMNNEKVAKLNKKMLINSKNVKKNIENDLSSCPSTAVSEYLYDEEEPIIQIKNGSYYIDNKKIVRNSYKMSYRDNTKIKLTKEYFNYPKRNKSDKEEILPECPNEFAILLYKFKDIKILTFQINQLTDLVIKANIMILYNMKWLFPNFKEIKIDLGNDELQKELNKVFEQRLVKLYRTTLRERKILFYDNDYKPRTMNCWEPENDIHYLKKNNSKNDKLKEKDYELIENCFDNLSSTYNNYLSCIYNETGKSTNLRYIEPLKNIRRENIKKFNDFFTEDDNEDEEFRFTGSNIEAPKFDRESIIAPFLKLDSLNINDSGNKTPNIIPIEKCVNKINDIYNMTSPEILSAFVEKNMNYFKMILIYCHFLRQQNNLEILSLYFSDSFSYEIVIFLRLFKIINNTFHFLIFANKISTLNEGNFSFNSLDSKSFENILGVIKKNENMSKLRISLFTPDINCRSSALLKLCASLKTSIREIFREMKLSNLVLNDCKDINIDYFLLNHKCLKHFELNMRNLFNLLSEKAKELFLKEIVLRFDIPVILISFEKYITVLLKFFLNIFTMITFEKNKIKTLKILAPEMQLNNDTFPFINQFFQQLKEGYCENFDEKNLENYLEEKIAREKIHFQEKEKKKEEKKLREEKKEKEKELEKKQLEGSKSSKFVKFADDKVKPKKKISQINIKDKENEAFQSKSSKNLHNIMVTKKDQKKSSLKKVNICIKKEEEKITETEKNPSNAETNKDKKLKKSSFKKSEFFINTNLKHMTIQCKFIKIPYIFNLCLMNNLSGLINIFLGDFDQTTFDGFLLDYKKYSKYLVNLTSLKISLNLSVTSYKLLEKDIIDYININTPNLKEKALYSNLDIESLEKMNQLVELVYFRSKLESLYVLISYNNKELLNQSMKNVIGKFKMTNKKEFMSLIILFSREEYKKLYIKHILENLLSFYLKKDNKIVICSESPNDIVDN